jgi:very-short-patch-repair endonuclease
MGEGWGEGFVMALVDPKRLAAARALRGRQTEAERRLWAAIRDGQLAGWKFRRQVPIGPWIADFACIAARLVVEIDGGQHAGSARDIARDADLAARGWHVVRFWNNDVTGNLDAVLAVLTSELETGGPHPGPLPSLRDGRGDRSGG